MVKPVCIIFLVWCH